MHMHVLNLIAGQARQQAISNPAGSDDAEPGFQERGWGQLHTTMNAKIVKNLVLFWYRRHSHE